MRTAKIGDQEWMAENLDVDHFRNGDPIPLAEDRGKWDLLRTGACCRPDASYGKIYNWLAVNDPRGLAPEGWHVPTDAEWQALVDYLGGFEVAGGKLKEAGTTHWNSPNDGATNESGFNALPGGYRSCEGHFDHMGYHAYYWSSTEAGSEWAFNRAVSYNNPRIQRGDPEKRYGYSVRCVKD